MAEGVGDGGDVIGMSGDAEPVFLDQFARVAEKDAEKGLAGLDVALELAGKGELVFGRERNDERIRLREPARHVRLRLASVELDRRAARCRLLLEVFELHAAAHEVELGIGDVRAGEAFEHIVQILRHAEVAREHEHNPRVWRRRGEVHRRGVPLWHELGLAVADFADARHEPPAAHADAVAALVDAAHEPVEERLARARASEAEPPYGVGPEVLCPDRGGLAPDGLEREERARHREGGRVVHEHAVVRASVPERPPEGHPAEVEVVEHLALHACVVAEDGAHAVDGDVEVFARGLVGLVFVAVVDAVKGVARHLGEHLHLVAEFLPLRDEVVHEEVLGIEPLDDDQDFAHAH